MVRIALWTAFLLVSFIPASQAGFEWIPPQDNPPQKGANEFDFDITPMPSPDKIGSKMITPVYKAPRAAAPEVEQRALQPAPDIMPEYSRLDSFRDSNRPKPQQPLRTRETSRSSLSSLSRYDEPNYYGGGVSPTYTNTRPALSPNREKTVSLFIDPFPMGSDSVMTESREMKAASIEQAMMEKVKKVHTMPLGNTMDTGAQLAYTNTPTVETPANNPISGIDSKSLTPVGTMGSVQSGPVNATAVTYTMAEGFGADLPLALAVSQVVPDNFTHNFALGVDPGTTVSWQGGKAWNLVLEDMLRPQGLTAEIKNNTVTIQPVMKL